MSSENIIEVWRPCPLIEWLYGSNLGNLKTVDHHTTRKDGRKRFVKGHDLPQYRKPNDYMQVCVCVNGKKKYLLVHRVIAACFLPNPDNLPQVNHKNCIRDDNRMENLEWCTQEYNNNYREKYGIPAKESTKILRKSLFAVDLKTEKTLFFNSQHEASQKTSVHVSAINMVIKRKLQQAGGYFFTESEDEITKEKLQSIKDNMLFLDGVIAIDIEDRKPLYFKSQHEAGRELGIANQNINKVLKGKRKTTGGYWFTNADSNAIEVTREKLGDTVAHKVKALMDKLI